MHLFWCDGANFIILLYRTSLNFPDLMVRDKSCMIFTAQRYAMEAQPRRGGKIIEQKTEMETNPEGVA